MILALSQELGSLGQAPSCQAREFGINSASKLFKERRDYPADGFQKLPARARNLVVLPVIVADEVCAGRQRSWFDRLRHIPAIAGMLFFGVPGLGARSILLFTVPPQTRALSVVW